MNSIELAKQFVPVLDEVYKNASLTSDLDGAAELELPLLNLTAENIAALKEG